MAACWYHLSNPNSKASNLQFLNKWDPHKLAEVTRCKWYMIHYNALTPKPHYAYSNSSRISQLDMGKLVRKTVDQDANLKTCETYVDSEGNKRFKGTKRLRQTELLMYICNMFFVDSLFPPMSSR